MANEKKKADKQDTFLDFSDSVSSMELTGLMPTPPTNRAEMEAYQDLFPSANPKRQVRLPGKREKRT